MKALLLFLVLAGGSAEARQWTIYLYMEASDSYVEACTSVRQLQDALKDDLEGRIAVHVDIQVGTSAERIIIERGTSSHTTVEVPFKRLEFLKEGVRGAFSSATEGNSLLIVSGHGTGILAPTFDSAQQKWLYEPDEGRSPCKRYCDVRIKEFYRQIEHIMNGKSMLVARAGGSFLSIHDLHELTSYATSVLQRKLDILGFDSCYMAMLEVAYQIKDTVHYLVASQDCEEKDGWDYKKVIESLSEYSALRAGKRLVYSYERSQILKGHERFSLSLLDLTSMNYLAEVIDKLVNTILQIDHLTEILCRARLSLHPVTALPFYVDMRESIEALYAELMEHQLTPDTELLISELLHAREVLSLMVDASVAGPLCKTLQGCSWYFPLSHIDSSYAGSFANERQWMNFLRYFTSGIH